MAFPIYSPPFHFFKKYHFLQNEAIKFFAWASYKFEIRNNLWILKNPAITQKNDSYFFQLLFLYLPDQRQSPNN